MEKETLEIIIKRLDRLEQVVVNIELASFFTCQGVSAKYP